MARYIHIGCILDGSTDSEDPDRLIDKWIHTSPLHRRLESIIRY